MRQWYYYPPCPAVWLVCSPLSSPSGSDDGTSSSSDVSSLKSACSLHESEDSNKDAVTEDSSPCSSGYLSTSENQYEPSSEGKQVKRVAETSGTTVSMGSARRSLGNLSNFKIIDTTLREGEQFATAFFDTEQKIKIAKALDHIGVDYVSLIYPTYELHLVGSQPRTARKLINLPPA